LFNLRDFGIRKRWAFAHLRGRFPFHAFF